MVYIRHEKAPSPMGCRWCGIVQRDHGWGWTPGAKLHNWAMPTKKQLNARLRIHLERLRNERNGNPPPRSW